MFTEADYLKTLKDFKDRISHLEMQNSLLQKEMVGLEEDNKKLFLERKNRSMLNRWGDSKDLIGAVVYLSTESSSYVTGQDIYVDGGWSNKGI